MQSFDRRDFEVLLEEMHAVLDRIADCWRADMSTHVTTIAGVTSDIVRSGVSTDPAAANGPALATLRTEIGHILTSQRAGSRHR